MVAYAEAVAIWMCRGAVDRFYPAIVEWREQDHGSLRDLSLQVVGQIKAWANSDEGMQSRVQALSSWAEAVEKDLAGLTDPLGEPFGVAGAFHLPPGFLVEDTIEIGYGPIEEAVTESVGRVILAIALTLWFGMAIAAGLAAALGGPAAWAIEVAGVAGAYLLVASRADIEGKLAKIDLPPKVRRALGPRAYRKVQKRATKLETQMAETTEAVLLDEEEDGPRRRIVNMLVNGSSDRPNLGVLPQLRQRASEMTVLIG